MREAQLKQEIEDDIEARLRKGCLKLKEREDRLISDSGLTDESLRGVLEAQDNKFAALNSRIESLGELLDIGVVADHISHQENITNDRCALIFDELHRDLEEFKRVMSSEYFIKLSKATTEPESGTYNQVVNIFRDLDSYVCSEISNLYPRPVGTTPEISTPTWSHQFIPEESVSLSAMEDLGTQVSMVEERISRLGEIPPQFSADEITLKIDEDFLGKIEHLTELILEKSLDTSDHTDYKFIAGICRLVLENNPEMLDNFLGAIDRFVELRVTSKGDKTGLRYIQSILGNWMQRANFSGTHSGSSVF